MPKGGTEGMRRRMGRREGYNKGRNIVKGERWKGKEGSLVGEGRTTRTESRKTDEDEKGRGRKRRGLAAVILNVGRTR